MADIIRAAGVIFLTACAVLWLVSLARWDGKSECDESECKSCPFPCEKYGQSRENK